MEIDTTGTKLRFQRCLLKVKRTGAFDDLSTMCIVIPGPNDFPSDTTIANHIQQHGGAPREAVVKSQVELYCSFVTELKRSVGPPRIDQTHGWDCRHCRRRQFGLRTLPLGRVSLTVTSCEFVPTHTQSNSTMADLV